MRFVCRWREESPFGKRVATTPDSTVLDWFRRGWDQDDPQAWIERELNGDVYGLDSVFEAARERDLPAPESVDQLRELLHDSWPLPAGTGAPGAVFHHDVPVRMVGPAGPGPESVFSVRLCWESPDTYRNLDLAGAVVFPGLTLPDLAAHLRAVDDPGAHGWPHDARLLRALVAAGEEALVAAGEEDAGAALERYARLPGYDPAPTGVTESPEHDAMHREVLKLLLPERPAGALIRVDPHLAQVARYIDGFFGFDQWFLFDTRWAAAHPDLARSLLRYAAHWDPYELPG